MYSWKGYSRESRREGETLPTHAPSFILSIALCTHVASRVLCIIVVAAVGADLVPRLDRGLHILVLSFLPFARLLLHPTVPVSDLTKLHGFEFGSTALATRQPCCFVM